MSTVTYLGRRHPVQVGQTVLDALLAAGEPIAHACRAGACGACIVRASAGELAPEAQAGLREDWRLRGYFHACLCRPSTDLVVEPLGAEARVAAHITERRTLSDSVVRVHIKLEAALPARAGQYLSLEGNGVARSYSIAALPAADLIELHVRRIPGGRLSPFLCDHARDGAPVMVQGPFGSCVYLDGRLDQPLLLAATGTGLAPLWAVLHDALAAHHRGSIQLFHGAVDPSGLYLVDELRQLAARHPSVTYHPVVTRDAAHGPPGTREGDLAAVIADQLPRSAGMRAFVCGDPGIVKRLRKQLFLSGTALRDLASDAFLPAAGDS